jgi:hypothetical protein
MPAFTKIGMVNVLPSIACYAATFPTPHNLFKYEGKYCVKAFWQ